MDDFIIYFCIIAVAVVSMFGIYRYTAVKLRESDVKIANSKKMTAVRNARTTRAAPVDQPLGAWVQDLADSFNFDADSLFDDEMPEEVVAVLNNPMVKSFIGRMAENIGQQQQQQTSIKLPGGV